MNELTTSTVWDLLQYWDWIADVSEYPLSDKIRLRQFVHDELERRTKANPPDPVPKPFAAMTIDELLAEHNRLHDDIVLIICELRTKRAAKDNQA